MPDCIAAYSFFYCGKTIGKIGIKNFETCDRCRRFVDKCRKMKKKTVSKKSLTENAIEKLPIFEDPTAPYGKSIQALPSLKDFTFNEFKKISKNTPFSLSEWSAMLHVSERTLQRYAKNNSSFAPINAERAMQLDRVIKKGKEVFGSADRFYNWLNQKPYMLEGQLSIESLNSATGIEMLITQLGRIEQGILA